MCVCVFVYVCIAMLVWTHHWHPTFLVRTILLVRTFCLVLTKKMLRWAVCVCVCVCVCVGGCLHFRKASLCLMPPWSSPCLILRRPAGALSHTAGKALRICGTVEKHNEPERKTFRQHKVLLLMYQQTLRHHSQLASKINSNFIVFSLLRNKCFLIHIL